MAGRLDEFGAFRLFCRSHVTTEDGFPFVLEPWEEVALADFFAGTRETLILVGKKSGKSTLMAALTLFALVTSEDREIAIAAASRDQAQLIARQAAGMVRRSPWLSERVRVNQRELRSRRDGGTIKILAADVDTVDGWLGDLAIVDELHRHKSADLYGVLRDGLGPRGGRQITISTAGDDEESPLGKLRQAAYTLPSVVRDGAYRCASNDDRSFVMHEWALDPGADRTDFELVKTALPASWVTPKSLRRAYESPSMTPWHWARFYCGIWERGEDGAIQPVEWDALAVPGLTIADGSEVYVGLDLGWRIDTTAIVPVHVDGERRIVAGPVILQPPGDGGLLDEREVEDALLEMCGRYRVLGVVFDPHAGAQQLSQRLEREHGVTFVEHSQDSSPMALAASRLMEAIRLGTLAHDGDRTLRAHVLGAAQRTVSGERWKFDRPRRGGRVPIDGLTALLMAHSVASEPAKKKNVIRFYG